MSSKYFDEAGSRRKGAKASVTILHPSVFVCWLRGLGVSLCLIQHVTDAVTLENPVTTMPTPQSYCRQTLFIFNSETRF